MQKMSEKEMSIQQAINVMERYTDILLSKTVIQAHNMAIQALEEIQQYRTTGMTPEQIKEMQMDYCAKGAVLEEYKEIGTVKELARLRSDYERVLKYNDDRGKIIDRYLAIGTLDQCREAVERMKEEEYE